MNRRWAVAESIIFLLFTLANAYPLFLHPFFPTLDGPLHSYNAHCIKELISGDMFLRDFITWNPFPNPNWTGHIIIAAANFFFSTWTSEKILVLCYLTGFPFAFRYLIKTLHPENYLATYLIFPFCYSNMLYYGFYNFSISLVFLFFITGFWIRHKNSLNVYKVIVLFLLATATYFSHVSVYLFSFCILFALLIRDETILFLKKRNTLKEYFRSMAVKTGVLLLSFGLTVWWTILFFLHKKVSVPSYLSKSELIENIRFLKPIVGFIQKEETEFSSKILLILVFLVLVVIVKRIYELKPGFMFSREIIVKKFTQMLNKGDLWLLFCSILMAAYFVLPDSDGWAGFFSFRLLLLFFLMLLVWLGTQKIPKFLLLISIIGILLFHIKLMIVRDKVTENLNIMAFQCTKVARLIPDNSIIYPVNLTQNWSMLHFDKYLGLCQPMLILDNSECNSNYFPLQWNWDKIPELYLDENNHRADSCFFYSNSEKQERRKIDYIFIMGKNYSNDLCKKNLLWFTHNRCDVVLNDGYFSLYKIK